MKTKTVEFITFLGPLGATFSHEAYDVLAEIYNAPPALNSEENATYCHPASSNIEIPESICRCGGYGTIAMETVADARETDSLEGFIRLLKKYDRLEVPVTDESEHQSGCPTHIIGAVKLEIHFCLMVRKNADLEALGKVFAHKKAAGACKKHMAVSGLQIIDVPSNGEGARLVSQDSRYSDYAALGPRSAAEKYGLEILHKNCEDQKAATTFFLLAPRYRKINIGTINRALIVFRLPHKPGSLVRALEPFGELNLIQIHSMHTGNGSYDFAIEIDVEEHELAIFHAAAEVFKTHVEKHLIFGPFEVVTR